MKKIIIIGCPGSGKSTFGGKLRDITGLPLYHLDMMYWNKDKTTVAKDVFLDRLYSAMNTEEWIIDGNYFSTMEERINRCDMVIFLDYATEVCIDGIEKRRGKPRSDMPWTDGEGTDEEFVDFVKNYNRDSKPKVIALLQKYSQKNIVVFSTRKDSEEFLKTLDVCPSGGI